MTTIINDLFSQLGLLNNPLEIGSLYTFDCKSSAKSRHYIV